MLKQNKVLYPHYPNYSSNPLKYCKSSSYMHRNKQNRNMNNFSHGNTNANNTLSHDHIEKDKQPVSQQFSQKQDSQVEKPIPNSNNSNNNNNEQTASRSISYKKLPKNDSKPTLSIRMKQQWQKCEKQLNEQISKLKKQNNRLRQQVKKANKNNQQYVCSYESYVKEIQTGRQQIAKKNKIYEEQLKYCIFWIVQAFSMAQNPAKHLELIENKLSKSKMGQVFQKLSKTIEQLQLQKYLKQVAISEPQEYLLYQKQQKSIPSTKQPKMSLSKLIIKTKIPKMHKVCNVHDQVPGKQQSFQQFNDLLDTFNLRKESSCNDQNNVNQYQQQQQQQHAENIARRLFVNQDTFGHEIGQHDISNQHYSHQQHQQQQQQQAFITNHSQTETYHIRSSLPIDKEKDKEKEKQYQNSNAPPHRQLKLKGDTFVTVSKNCHQQNEDYLKVKVGDRVKLLRKIGQLWIAQFGVKIGYISEDVLHPY